MVDHYPFPPLLEGGQEGAFIAIFWVKLQNNIQSHNNLNKKNMRKITRALKKSLLTLFNN